MSVTLSQLKEQALAISTQPEEGVYTDSYLVVLANEVINDICDGWKWQFLARTMLINTYQNYTLSADITAGDVTIDIEDNELPTSGTIYIGGEVITYTANDGDQLSGLTAVYSHNEGDVVELVYALPTYYGRKPNLKRDTIDYLFIDQVEYDGSPDDKVWTLVYDDSGNGYIRIKYNGADTFKFWYQREANTLSDDSDETIIPDKFALKVVPRLMAGKMMIERYDDPDGLGSTNLQLGEQELLKMQKYYGQREEPISRLIRTNYRATKPKRVIING